MGADPFQALQQLLSSTMRQAVPAAEIAAARKYRSAARAAAPVDSGQLRRSINIIESKDKSPLYVGLDSGAGGLRRRLFVGPEKKQGYYGYFVEHGWNAPLGPSETFHALRGGLARSYRERGLPGRPFESRRVARPAGRAAHSQQGLTKTKQIAGTLWFRQAIARADAAAYAAAEAAFNRKLSELNSRG